MVPPSMVGACDSGLPLPVAVASLNLTTPDAAGVLMTHATFPTIRVTLDAAKSQILSNVLDVAHQLIKKVNPDEPKGENCSTKGISKSQHKTKSLLLQGSSSEVS
ncbi:hypothetical protein J1605_017130 [Eschrichtius robustus]|uniref:Uncharacterized protein n=1 Tax=Eschrichtius robustus TaxID=9764 RepID=A0AB34I581_ESCRO|nr:hypothetical protein J1605_017130 [Eschrichtius robustus]